MRQGTGVLLLFINLIIFTLTCIYTEGLLSYILWFICLIMLIVIFVKTDDSIKM